MWYPGYTVRLGLNFVFNRSSSKKISLAVDIPSKYLRIVNWFAMLNSMIFNQTMYFLCIIMLIIYKFGLLAI